MEEEFSIKEVELRKIFNNIVERTQLTENEKKEIFEVLRTETIELDDSNREFLRLQRIMQDFNDSGGLNPDLRDMIMTNLVKRLEELPDDYSNFGLYDLFTKVMNNLPLSNRLALMIYRYLSKDGVLAERGERLFREISQELQL